MKEISSVNEKENYVLVSVDSKIYPLDVIYTAAYVFLERAYLILDGDPKKEVFVKLTAKNKSSKEELDILGKEFLNELINYGFYKKQSEKNKEIKQILLQRALLTNLGGEVNSDEDLESIDSLENLEDSEEIIDDPEGIAIPWEEKYGNKKKKIKINKKEGEICFLLNEDFYTLKEIKKTLEDFKEVCEGKVEKNREKGIKIILKSNDFSMLNTLKHEFCNYSLGLMKNNM